MPDPPRVPFQVGRSAIPIAAVYVALYTLTVLGRFVSTITYLVYVAAIAFPLTVAAATRDWHSIGITSRNWKPAIWAGMATGTIVATLTLIALAAMGQIQSPANLLQQLLVGIPVAFLVISPFQELLFRGWMQPRLQQSVGTVKGLVLCAILFALWDALPPLRGVSLPSALWASAQLIPLSLGFALVVGVLYYRTGNLIAPWIAHAIAVISLVVAGRFLPLR